MKNLHLLAVVCFFIATILYVVGSSISLGLGALGFIFECVAWFNWFKADRDVKLESIKKDEYSE